MSVPSLSGTVMSCPWPLQYNRNVLVLCQQVCPRSEMLQIMIKVLVAFSHLKGCLDQKDQLVLFKESLAYIEESEIRNSFCQVGDALLNIL